MSQNSRSLMNPKVLWITETAILVALLVVMQAVTASLGNTIITGSIVNLILIVAVMLVGLSSGLTVAAISPIAAKLAGIGPLWELIPFIMLGNIVLVLVWHFLGNMRYANGTIVKTIAAIVAAIAKFATLYATIILLAAPLLLKLPPAAPVYTMFSFPQLFTALIGGGIAIFILPLLQKALKR